MNKENLILKFHQKHLAFYLNKDNYGIIRVDINLVVSGDRLLYARLRTDDLRNAVKSLE